MVLEPPNESPRKRQARLLDEAKAKRLSEAIERVGEEVSRTRKDLEVSSTTARYAL